MEDNISSIENNYIINKELELNTRKSNRRINAVILDVLIVLDFL